MSLSLEAPKVIEAEVIETKTTRRKLHFTWEHGAFAAILALAAGLYLFMLDRNGYSNEYYASAVKSMLTSWSNFFFASFDPGGFITVDKPPVALWIQTISAAIFGFSSFSILLPSVLAGVGSVALLHNMVKKHFGVTAGLVAALALALTPISVVMSRHNNPDSILVFTMLLAAWALLKATEKAKLRWLLLSVVLVGVAFNIKMLQAFLILPAFYLVYFLLAKTGWRKRIWHLMVATVLLVAVSLSWAVAVDLTPADQRPYIGSSSNNSVLSLILDYNGLGRIFGENKGGSGGAANTGGTPPAGMTAGEGFTPPTGTTGTDGFTPPAGMTPPTGMGDGGGAGGPGGGTGFGGQSGITRLLVPGLAGEYGWLLPLAIIGGLLATWQTFRHDHGNERRKRLSGLLLWGGWFGVHFIVFSFASGIFHNYYLTAIAPGVAALVGIGFAALWKDFRSKGWILPVALLATAAWEYYLLNSYSGWGFWGIVALALTGVTVVGLVGTRLFKLNLSGKWAKSVVVAGLMAIMLAPALISGNVLRTAQGGSLPSAIPSGNSSGMQGGGNPGQSTSTNSQLISYLEANYSGSGYLVAVNSSQSADPIILQTGLPVMTLGGFSGSDNVLTVAQLAQKIADKEIRFFLVEGNGGGGPNGGNSQLTSYVTSKCTLVNSSLYSVSSTTTTQTTSTTTDAVRPDDGGRQGGGGTLYDCGSVS